MNVSAAAIDYFYNQVFYQFIIIALHRLQFSVYYNVEIYI